MSSNLENVLREASTGVLETMFFADVSPVVTGEGVHDDALSCVLHCSGAENGSFTVAVDRAALQVLSEAFYGDDDQPSETKERELLCELTNMLAGSTLSTYAPAHYCPLSSPQLCDLDLHEKTGTPNADGELRTSVSFGLEGGLLSVSCALKVAA